MNYTNHNANAWNAIAKEVSEDARNKFTRSVSHEEYIRAKNGELKVSLTSAKYVPLNWFPPLKGLKILGLASGG